MIANSELKTGLRAVLVLKEINGSQIPMYATRLMAEIYHLVQPGGQHTLCGLRISRVFSERRTNTLQLVSEAPTNLTICKHCERIQGQENNFAAD